MKVFQSLVLVFLGCSYARAQWPAPAETPFQGFKDESSLGITIVSGNSNSQSYNAKQLSESFSLFTSYGLDTDLYSGYVQKNNFDLGGKYFLVKNDETAWSTEAGYRYSTTHYPADLITGVDLSDNATSSVRLYNEATQTISKTATFRISSQVLRDEEKYAKRI